MLEILKELCSSKKMVSIYTDNQETDKFHYGTIIAVNEKEIAIQMISPDGEDDGIIVMDVEKVIRIELDGQYDAKMKKLCLTKENALLDIAIDNEDILGSLLSIAFTEQSVISMELFDSGYYDIVGVIECLRNNLCKIRQIDEYGYDDGISYVSICDITKLSFMSQDEKRISSLLQINKVKSK